MSAPLNISAEERSLMCFEDFEKQNYPLRLAYYKDNKYFYKGKFSALTNGIGETRFFRAYLNEFIKSYKPELINKEKEQCEKQASGLEARLQNPDFVNKAPENVVAAERDRLAKLKERLAKLEESIAAMK